MTSKNNRAPRLYYIKHCASFQSHQWTQTGITVRQCSIRVKIYFGSVWAWNLADDLENQKDTFPILRHSLSIISKNSNWSDGPETLNSGQIGDFLAAWPRNLTDDLDKQQGNSSIPRQALCVISKPSVNSNWGYSPETSNWGRNRWFSVLCDLEIWLMTLKNNRAPLLCYFKLFASFHSYL